MDSKNSSFVNAFHFKDCYNLNIQGGGTIQGENKTELKNV